VSSFGNEVERRFFVFDKEKDPFKGMFPEAYVLLRENEAD